MDAFTGKVAVVTGAGSGLGRALACELAARGARVAMCDSDEPGLAQTAELIGGSDGYGEVVDVAERAAVHRFARAVRERFGVVHQIYNNAGIAHVGTIEDIEYAELEKLFAVNFWGVVHGTKEFLPYLTESQDGHVVNVSSLFGMVAAPWMGGYDATKFAVRGFTEALRGEMRALRRPVKVTCVHPGGIRTQIVERADSGANVDKAAVERGFRRIAASSPTHAARVILRGVTRNKPRVLVGIDARAALLAERMNGVGYEPVAAWTARWFVPRGQNGSG
jgi:NAD(P)-dependent dehydrogenase (short-subunit alcohol dehydrogenase family)